MMRMQRLSNPSKAAISARTFLVLCAAGLALVGCATVTSVGTDPIDSRYSVGGGEWNSGGGITIAARAFERNGVTVICGAWTMDRQSVMTSELNDAVLEAGSVFLDGDRSAEPVVHATGAIFRQHRRRTGELCSGRPSLEGGLRRGAREGPDTAHGLRAGRPAGKLFGIPRDAQG